MLTFAALRRQERAVLFATSISVVALVVLLNPIALAQEAKPPAGEPAPDLPAVEVPQPAASSPAKPKPKAAATAADAPPAGSAPISQTVAAPDAPDPALALGTYNPALDIRNFELPPGTTLTRQQDRSLATKR